MYVRVSSGGRLILLVLILLHGADAASGADLVTAEPPPTPPDLENAPLLLNITPQISGFIELSSSLGKADLEQTAEKSSGWALRGAVNVPINAHWHIQIDSQFDKLKFGELSDQNLSFGAHAYHRKEDQYAVGLYAQYERLSAATLALGPMETSAGLEGAVFLSQSTVLGQVGLGKGHLEEQDASKLNGLIGARYYHTDNLRFDLDAGFEQLLSDDAALKTYSVSTAANYRLSNRPITAFGGYRYRSSSLTSGETHSEDMTSHGIVAGFRYHFGSTSLKDEERNGPLWTAAPYLDY